MGTIKQLITLNVTWSLLCFVWRLLSGSGSGHVLRNTSEVTSSRLSLFVCQKPSLFAYYLAKKQHLEHFCLSQVIDGLDWSCCNSCGSLEPRYLLIKIHKILFNNLLLFDPNDTEFHNAFFLAWFTLLKKKEQKVSEEELMYSFDLKGWVPFHSARLNHSTLIPFFKQKPSTVVQRE